MFSCDQPAVTLQNRKEPSCCETCRIRSSRLSIDFWRSIAFCELQGLRKLTEINCFRARRCSRKPDHVILGRCNEKPSTTHEVSQHVSQSGIACNHTPF